MKLMGTMKHEQITETLIGGLKIRNITYEADGWY